MSPKNPQIINWHRAFGIAIKKLISDYGYHVKTEVEVSQQKQLLDLIIIRQEQQKPIHQKAKLCDGFDNLSKHNLISYKSLHESFNTYAAEELYSYYINYSKLDEQQALKLSRDDYQLYGITTRMPKKLLQTVRYKQTKPGIYDLNTQGKRIKNLP